jgi:hypothetical protein
MLKDMNIIRAVSRISQRAERQDNIKKVVGTYVDVGLLPQIDNRNHQIFYGRRGTGKTHVMKVLESRLRSEALNTVIYIDCRTLGSTSQFSDSSVPLPQRCLSLFRDFLVEIYQGLLEHICECPSSRAEEALKALDILMEAITEPDSTLKPGKVTVSEHTSRSTQGNTQVGGGLAAGTPQISLGASSRTGRSETTETRTEFHPHDAEKVRFPNLLSSLRYVLSLSETSLFVLIDEWSSLPLDIQPYLADFLKRGLLPASNVTVKVSALEYRCRFSERVGVHMTGFELGADISTAPDLDDYFVFDRNPDRITDVYADVLFRHLSSDLPDGYLQKSHSISSPEQFMLEMFTERNTFAQLARACEGVIRDLINIFTAAVFNAHRRDRKSIDKKAVLESSRSWFEQDKARYLDENLQTVLRKIVDEVIGKRKARSFLLPRELERHPVIQKLFDARVLHHMQRGYADKDKPGVRYNIYAIDYGAYVDLIGTSKQPEMDLGVPTEDADVIVPFDDKRSIRRIVLDAGVLE